MRQRNALRVSMASEGGISYREAYSMPLAHMELLIKEINVINKERERASKRG